MYEIREARTGDELKIAKVHVDCWRECYPFIPKAVHDSRGLLYRRSQWRNAIEKSKAIPEPVFVLLEDGRVEGFANIKLNVDADIPEAEFELHACYFLPAHRGTVAGPLMLSRLLTAISAMGGRSFCVWVFAGNPMRITYRVAGLRQIIKRDRDLLGEKIPEIGLLANDLDRLRGLSDRMISGFRSLPNDASGNRRRSQDRYSRICERICRYPR